MLLIGTARGAGVLTTAVGTTAKQAASFRLGAFGLTIRTNLQRLGSFYDARSNLYAGQILHLGNNRAFPRAGVGCRTPVVVRTAMNAVFTANGLRLGTASIARYVDKRATGALVATLALLIRTNDSRSQTAALEDEKKE